MKLFKLVFIVLIGAFALTANAASPKATGYLLDYDRLVEGEYLEAYWIDMAVIERTEQPNILLGDIAIKGVKDHKGVTVADCVGWLKNDLLGGAIVSADQGAPYRLELAITHMDPGSAAKRIWAGEFGAGHAMLQIEGKVVDVESGAVIAEFAERRRSSGAIGVEDLGGDAGPHIIEHLVSLISADVSRELLASLLLRD
jgi:hypothetical protein